jgi:Fic family protein
MRQAGFLTRYLDRMTEQEPGAPAPSYEPFPDFDEWNGSEFDPTTIDRFAALLTTTRQTVEPEQLRRAVETATRWAAVDTGAIEGLYEVSRGFTMSVAVGAAAWENIHEVVGKDAERTIHDAMAGYEFVLDVATNAQPMSESLIKQLHETLCASQETYRVITDHGPQEQALPKGEYKEHPNNPFNISRGEIHSYASVLDTPPEMGRLIEQLRSEAFVAAHPIVQAAYAHYAFVCIHPFADGNGRVSRALASAYLYRSPGVPLVVFADQKADYIDTLEQADAGDARAFVQFVAERVIDTIEMVRTNISRPVRPSVQERLKQIAPVLTGRGGLTHAEIDAIGQRLVNAIGAQIDVVLANNPMIPPFSASRSANQTSGKPPDGYRAVPGSQTPKFDMNAAAPGTAHVTRGYSVGISLPNADGADFIIFKAGEVLVEAPLREVHPTISRSFEYRLTTVLEDEFLDLLDQLAEKSTQKLIATGYYVPPDEPSS